MHTAHKPSRIQQLCIYVHINVYILSDTRYFVSDEHIIIRSIILRFGTNTNLLHA